MPNGQFWYGPYGFLFKKSGGGGARRNPSYGAICNQPQNVNNKYVPGAGVGGTNIAVRRSKLIRATSCNKSQQCGRFYKYLGFPIQPNIPTTITKIFDVVGDFTWTAPEYTTSIYYFVVGGGGGGGAGYSLRTGGGGGAGTIAYGNAFVTPGETYSIHVGDGGIGGVYLPIPEPIPEPPYYISETNGSPGDYSRFGSIIANGGDGAFSSRRGDPILHGDGGAMATPTTAAGGGQPYGTKPDTFITLGAGGGGGNTSNGQNGYPLQTIDSINYFYGGSGGSGITSNITGTNVTYGVGGDGGDLITSRVNINPRNGYPGEPNTGNGGEGAFLTGKSPIANANGGKGGSGIVVIKYNVYKHSPW